MLFKKKDNFNKKKENVRYDTATGIKQSQIFITKWGKIVYKEESTAAIKNSWPL